MTTTTPHRFELLADAIRAAEQVDEAARREADARRLHERNAARQRLANYLQNIAQVTLDEDDDAYITCSADGRIQGAVIDGVGLILALVPNISTGDALAHPPARWFGLGPDDTVVALTCLDPVSWNEVTHLPGPGLADLGHVLRDCVFTDGDGTYFVPSLGWRDDYEATS